MSDKDKSVDFNSSPVSSNVSFLNSSKDEITRINQKKGQGGNYFNNRQNAQSESLSPESHQKDHLNDKRASRNFIKKTSQNFNKPGKNQQQQQQNPAQINNHKMNHKRKAQNKIDDLEKVHKKTQHAQPPTQTAAVTFLYYPGERYPDLSEYVTQIIEIRIASEYITKYNKQVIQRQLWGNDSYTSESDAVCMLVHSGIIDPQFSSPLIDDYEGISLFCKITRSRKSYVQTSRNGFVSRTHKNHVGYSIKPESHTWLPRLGQEEELANFARGMATWNSSKRKKNTNVLGPEKSKYLQSIPEVNIVFNLNNEPAFRYSCVNICDKGNDSKSWKSYKMKTFVMYIDTLQNERFEISRQCGQNLSDEQEQQEPNLFGFDQYRVVQVLNPYELDNYAMEKYSKPLPNDLVKVIFEDLDWSDIQWGQSSVLVKDFDIQNVCSHKYYPRTDV